MTGIQKAVDAAKTQQALADQLGVSQQMISKWVKRGYAPAERAVEIEAQYGVSRSELIKPSLRSLLEA